MFFVYNGNLAYGPKVNATSSGDTLWRDDCQLIGMPVILLATELKKNKQKRTTGNSGQIFHFQS